MSPFRRDAGDVPEVEALITDRYLDALLAVQPALESASSERSDLPEGPEASLGAAVRAVSRRLATDLPHFHPSFRFEERLALRLAEVAASMRLPLAAGGEGQVVPLRLVEPPRADPLVIAPDETDTRPLLIGGAVAASALSLAGAWLAWRRRTVPQSPMARAVRAAHNLRLPGTGA